MKYPSPNTDKPFIGVVLGGDMNSYAVARAYYEAYGMKTVILGKHPLYPTTHSRLTECYYNPELQNAETLLGMLREINTVYPEKKKILHGNTDYYVELILHNRAAIEALGMNYIIPMTTEEQFRELFRKDSFYTLCEKHGLPYPHSDVLVMSASYENYEPPFPFPVFMKPADTTEYAALDFPGKQKGYRLEDADELKKAARAAYEAGFRGRFMVQEYIPGTDENMFVYTAYADRDHVVRAMSAGKILMHDRTPRLIGNYNAITNGCDEALCMRLKAFIEAIGFTGICHFDIQFDKRRGDYVIFEMNIRQGRSNYYTLANGVNLMKLIADEYVYGKKPDFFIGQRPFTVSIVPRAALIKRVPDAPTEGFSRFTLAPYDRSPARYYYQALWDRNILRDYRETEAIAHGTDK